MLISALPLATLTVLVFFPPFPAGESILNGIWLGLMLCLFYIAFTGYVNPYLALISELGHNKNSRLALSTAVAFFGLLGLVLAAMIVPILTGKLQDGGMGMRESYQAAVLAMAVIAAAILYTTTISFNEKRNCREVKKMSTGPWESLTKTLQIRPFRILLTGEIFLQFSMNIVTLGMLYYAVVIFQQDQSFMTVLAGLTITAALLSFPLVNKMAKRLGKKKMILLGMLIMSLCSLFIFILSWHMSGLYFYMAMAMFGLAGIPLAVLTILINPTIADLARADALVTGMPREAMFFGARAIPLKLTIAAAGVTFAFLLSSFGKDMDAPLGVQLSILVVAISSFLGYMFFCRFPEEEVEANLQLYEEGNIK